MTFRCSECGRITERFFATLEGPEGFFDGVVQYCHFCDVGFCRLPGSGLEMVEIVGHGMYKEGRAGIASMEESAVGLL